MTCFLLSQFEYKLDREFLKGCKLSVTDDKDMVLALRNSLIESDVSIWPSTVSTLTQGHLVQQPSPETSRTGQKLHL